MNGFDFRGTVWFRGGGGGTENDLNCYNSRNICHSEERLCNDDLSLGRTASVLASCTLQSAILFTNGAMHSTLSGTDMIQTESLAN